MLDIMSVAMEPIKIIQGVVQKGRNRGKNLGFPTINMPLSEPIEEGIYLSYISIADRQYNALTFIGPAKTFGETEPFAETYVLHFDQDIYGQTVTVSLLKKLRDNIKFESEEALIKQMEEDKRQAEEFFNKPGNK